MSKKTRAKAAPAKKPVHPLLSKLAEVISVGVFAALPILVGVYFLAMALGGFLYNNQQRFDVPPFLRSMFGFDLSRQARALIGDGIPEEVVTAFKMYGDSQYELGAPVMPVAYAAEPQSIRVVMDTFQAARGAWRGSSAGLTFPSGGAAAQADAETRSEDWKDSMTGRKIDVYPWAAFQVTFDESALHTYVQAEVILDVEYAKPGKTSSDWTRTTVTLTRPLRFYVLSPEEMAKLRARIPRPDNVRLPLMNPLNPVFWALILIGSGIWILRTLKQGRAQ